MDLNDFPRFLGKSGKYEIHPLSYVQVYWLRSLLLDFNGAPLPQFVRRMNTRINMRNTSAGAISDLDMVVDPAGTFAVENIASFSMSAGPAAVFTRGNGNPDGFRFHVASSSGITLLQYIIRRIMLILVAE